MNDAPMLRITHAAIRRSGDVVVHAGELAVPLGATVGVVGLNGAGKSTLMMALAGGLADHSATVRVDTPAGPVLAVGYVPQHPRFPEWLTVGETARLYGVSPEELVATIPEFELDRLLAQRMPTLSGGQRQLFAVALALCQRVDLLVLDEPLSALDIRRRRQVLERLRHRDARERSVVRLISSQVAADIADVCDWLVVLRSGRYVFQGARDSLPDTVTRPNGVSAAQDERRDFEARILDLLAE